MGNIFSAALSIGNSSDNVQQNIDTNQNTDDNNKTDTNNNVNNNKHQQQYPSPNVLPVHLNGKTKLTKKNKWNFVGDYHDNWEKNLIPLNPKMLNDYNKSMIITKHWIRKSSIFNLPDYIDIIVAEFYVLPRCSNCGKYDNLWLNLGDGFIGCGRKFYAYPNKGGNGCSLLHYNNYQKTKQENDKIHITVKLGTISATGADVFDYHRKDLIFTADYGDDTDDDDDINHDNEHDINDHINNDDDDDDDEKNGNDDKLTMNELKEMLRFWGIEMNRMYHYDKTLSDITIELDDTFHKNPYSAFTSTSVENGQ